MTAIGILALTMLGSYLLGAIPFGYLIAKAKGINIFEKGSGNIGATNVGRWLGKRIGFLVFVLDFLKGALPTFLAGFVPESMQETMIPHLFPVMAGLSAFLGHCFPVYLKFRGGKGVATGAGVVTILMPLATLTALVTWFIIVSVTWQVAIASIAAPITICAVHIGRTSQPFASSAILITAFALGITLLIIIRHHSNIRNLLNGQERILKDPRLMFNIGKVIHMMALALWFGMGMFFTWVVAFALFGSFESVAALDANERPLWLPLAQEYEKSVSVEPTGKTQRPKPLRILQGRQAAGHAISPMFDSYFTIQMICAVIVVATAVGWTFRSKLSKRHRWRGIVVTLALITVMVGWWMEKKVSHLRTERAIKTSELLKSAKSLDLSEGFPGDREFTRWHVASIFVNLGTLAFLIAAVALAVFLPSMEEMHHPDLNSSTDPESEN